MTTEEKLIALADKHITLWENHEYLGDEEVWMLAKALKLVLEYAAAMRDAPDIFAVGILYGSLKQKLDALVKDL